MTGGGRPPSPEDGGFATVWTAGAVMVLLALMAMFTLLGTATVARHRAAGAADLAALAAAGYARAGDQEACRRASGVAERMGARIESCALRGWDAFVEVSVDPGGLLADFGPATARARAGPADDR